MKYSSKSLSLYRDIIENYHGSIMVVDRTGTIVFVNKGCRDLTQRTDEELIGWSAYDLLRTRVFSRSTLVESLESGQVTTRYLTINEDEHRGILARGVPFLDENGAVDHVIAYSQDETFATEYFAKLESEKQQMRQMFHYLLKAGGKSEGKREFIAESPKTKELFHFAETISAVSATVIIYGESGTGKEVLARCIYECSALADQIFIPINCAAIPEELMESEFFGYEKGAFTGANREGKPGLFELADHGTLFLDEIGDLPLSMQSKLLRVLEAGEFKRLGGVTIKSVNVRIIAATNRNLEEMVKQGTFREDLYYRLNVIPLHIPPLRERPEDLGPLIDFFLVKYNQKHHLDTVLSAETRDHLLHYSWPGNVRELKNVMERLVITGGAFIGSTLLVDTNKKGQASAWPASGLAAPVLPQDSMPYKDYMDLSEKTYLEAVLTGCGGNVAQAAAKMGAHLSSLYRKLEKHHINPKTFKRA